MRSTSWSTARSSSIAMTPRCIRLGPGEWFGERGLLDHAPRNATVTTAVDSNVLRLEGSVLLDALEAAPTMRSELVERRSPAGDARGRHRARRRPSVGAGVSVAGAVVAVVGAGLRGQAHDLRPDGRARRPARDRGRAGALVAVAGGARGSRRRGSRHRSSETRIATRRRCSTRWPRPACGRTAS